MTQQIIRVTDDTTTDELAPAEHVRLRQATAVPHRRLARRDRMGQGAPTYGWCTGRLARLTIRLFGINVFEIEQADDEAEVDFEPSYQDAGTIASTPVAVGDVPWGDVEGLHVYEPAEGDEGDEGKRLGFR